MRDPRFRAHGVGIRWQEQGHDLDFPIRTAWFSGGDIAAGLAQFDWSKTAVLCHHAHFDGLILAHHYGVRPALWLDTLSMARALIGNHLSVSLESLAAHFGLSGKSIDYGSFKGKTWEELTAAERDGLARGCVQDVTLTYDIFCRLAADFPLDELLLIDSTIRMFTEPVLIGDTDRLASVWETEARDRAALLAELQVTKKELNSNEKFAALLRHEGEEPQQKEGKNGPIYAFAATDDYMRGLLEHDAPRVRALAEARLAAKSNIVQTRSERLGWMSTRGAMCIYLAYCAAHTTRWGGGDGCLAADTLVPIFDPQKGLTRKRIVDILLDDLVWDGEEFVAHDGVVFQGYQEVIEHDGITGTAGHKVFTASGGFTTLEDAAARGIRLERAREPPSE